MEKHMGSTETLLASPELKNSVFLSLLRLEFDETGSHLLETKEQEHVINVLSGTCDLHLQAC